jgi:hypothetical protein
MVVNARRRNNDCTNIKGLSRKTLLVDTSVFCVVRSVDIYMVIRREYLFMQLSVRTDFAPTTNSIRSFSNHEILYHLHHLHGRPCGCDRTARLLCEYPQPRIRRSHNPNNTNQGKCISEGVRATGCTSVNTRCICESPQFLVTVESCSSRCGTIFGEGE